VALTTWNGLPSNSKGGDEGEVAGPGSGLVVLVTLAAGVAAGSTDNFVTIEVAPEVGSGEVTDEIMPVVQVMSVTAQVEPGLVVGCGSGVTTPTTGRVGFRTGAAMTGARGTTGGDGTTAVTGANGAVVGDTDTDASPPAVEVPAGTEIATS